MHFQKIGDPIVLPIVEGYSNLSEAQKEKVNDQGWWEDDFPIAKWEIFFEFNGSIFSEEMDLIPVTAFNVLRDTYQYYFSAGADKWFALNWVRSEGVRNSVHIQEIEET